MKTIKQLVKELCKREGLKKQVDVAQISEIVGHLSDIVYEYSSAVDFPLYMMLHKNGEKRAKKKAKR